jgi:membrane-associated protease RseP (regulator of RpoE activity)
MSSRTEFLASRTSREVLHVPHVVLYAIVVIGARRCDSIGGPAEKAGIRAGDRILEVDGMPTDGQDVLSILIGEPGDRVVLFVQPGVFLLCSETRDQKALKAPDN